VRKCDHAPKSDVERDALAKNVFFVRSCNSKFHPVGSGSRGGHRNGGDLLLNDCLAMVQNLLRSVARLTPDLEMVEVIENGLRGRAERFHDKLD
jgi:hypothetical protein